MDRWEGRVALVTGASAGFGAAIAKRLVEHGMKVVGCARNITKIQVRMLTLPIDLYLRDLSTHTVNKLLQKLIYVKHIQYSLLSNKDAIS